MNFKIIRTDSQFYVELRSGTVHGPFVDQTTMERFIEECVPPGGGDPVEESLKLADLQHATRPDDAWVVCGEAGAYSNHLVWIVGAFTAREIAELFASELGRVAGRLFDMLEDAGQDQYSFEWEEWTGREEALRVRGVLQHFDPKGWEGDWPPVWNGDLEYSVAPMTLNRCLDPDGESLKGGHG